MGVSRQDIFGKSPRAEPATPGSYGLAPAGFRLPAATRLGPVRLQVADLGRSLAFYEGTLGLRRLKREGSRALLGSALAWGSARPRLAWPYGAAAVALLLVHAPWSALFEGRRGGGR